jgi:NAD(P)H-hydrate repair Nnr-like enzyme with NAD(P)H-hydrate dehydratase domain
MKRILLVSALAATSASAETTNATIEDVYATVVEQTPYTRQVCQNVEVPIYGTVTRQGGGASGGDVLTGMILGGLLGKGATGKDDGAAAGAVLGGIIAADKANKPRTETVITGYKTERQCENVTEYKNVNKKVYDYSIITFKSKDGYEYSLPFTK